MCIVFSRVDMLVELAHVPMNKRQCDKRMNLDQP